MLVIVNVFADGIRHIRAQLLSSRPRRALGSARASQATKQRPSDNRCHGQSTLAKLMLSQKKKEIQYRSVNILECSHLPCFAVNWDGRTRQVLCDPNPIQQQRQSSGGHQITSEGKCPHDRSTSVRGIHNSSRIAQFATKLKDQQGINLVAVQQPCQKTQQHHRTH